MRDNPVEKEYRIQKSEVSQELDSVSCILTPLEGPGLS